MPDFLVKRLGGRLSIKEASQALKSLEDTGVLKADAEGVLRPSGDQLRSSDEIESVAVRSYHKSCLDLGKRCLEDAVEQREFASINVVTSVRTRALLKQKIKQFRDEIAELLPLADETDQEVCQINIQFLQLTK